ncbi:MAG: hypothetical protein IT288_11135 [Bdellovibrionales bacterium]|nr:hypothetical protein [Bdellovibrionales bacterium]
MRTLCLNLHKTEKHSVAENFLPFSPRVQFRDPGFIFADISGTTHLFGNEATLLSEALQVAREFYPEATAAIADTPAPAQVFSAFHHTTIVPPTQERDDLRNLPLEALLHLEGLITWHSSREIEDIISFFHVLGMKTVGELDRFQMESLRERWGDTGATLWKRLHGIEKQVISPLLPSESLTDYIYFDFPVMLLPFLLHCVEKSLRQLQRRLQGRAEFVRKVQIHLYCEYSSKCHVVELMPATPSRDLDLLMKLLENKLTEVDFDNPIREVEIEILPCPERVQQLDFWETRNRDRDKLDQLVSLFNQASLTTGFLRPRHDILPEESWELTAEFEEFSPQEDAVEVDGQSFRVKPSYSQHLVHAPRPTRLLKKPRRVSASELRQMHFLSSHPIERLEDSWWEDSRGRDYYFALSPQGQCLWLFFDRLENEYYLHGYFD